MPSLATRRISLDDVRARLGSGSIVLPGQLETAAIGGASPVPVPGLGLLPQGDMAEGFTPAAVPRSPVSWPMYRLQPLPVVQPSAKAQNLASAPGAVAATTAKVFKPSTPPPANFAAAATGSAAGVTVSWTPPPSNGADATGALLKNLVSFQVWRGPLGGGFGAATLLATVQNSSTPGAYSFLDANGLTSQYEYYVVPVTQTGSANPTLAVNPVVALSSTQVPPTKAGGAGSGQILAIHINNQGTGYLQEDTLDIGGAGSGGSVQVTRISGGHVTGISLVAGGAGYVVASNVPTSGGTGTGCTVDITSVA